MKAAAAAREAALGGLEVATSRLTEPMLPGLSPQDLLLVARARESPTAAATATVGPRTCAWAEAAILLPRELQVVEAWPAGPALTITRTAPPPSCPTPEPLYREGTVPPPWVCCRCRGAAEGCSGRTGNSRYRNRKACLLEWVEEGRSWEVEELTCSSSRRTYRRRTYSSSR